MKSKTATIAFVILTSISALLSGCGTVGQVKDVDISTGRIKTASKATATVVKSEVINLKERRQLLLVLGGEFMREQTKKLGYFDVVVDRAEMEKLLIKEGKDGLVDNVVNLLAWKKIASSYKPLLVLKFDTRSEGGSDYARLMVVDPLTAEDVFISEIKLDFAWKGVNDDNTFYPLFNTLLDWLEKNK
jgi:hypothetical protein